MEPLWSPAVATSRNRWQMGGRRERLRQAKTVAVGCDQLPKKFHGKERVCHRLPPVAEVPLSEKEGVDFRKAERRLSLAAAVRARTLVASATGARLSDHTAMISHLSRDRRRPSPLPAR